MLTSVYGTSVTGAANTAFINLFNQLFPSQKAAGPLANANYAYDAVISLALADDYAKTTNGTTVAHDMTKVTNPPGTACYTYASCLALIKAGTKINYEGASGNLDYNQYNNTFGPYGAFQSTASGLEQQVYVMSAQRAGGSHAVARRRPGPPPAGPAAGPSAARRMREQDRMRWRARSPECTCSTWPGCSPARTRRCCSATWAPR